MSLRVERLECCLTPGFIAAQAFDVGTNPQSVAVGDFNGAGRLDLAVANHELGSNNVSVLLGNGDGSSKRLMLATSPGAIPSRWPSRRFSSPA